MIKVFKFGGASVNSAERIAKMAEILEFYKNVPLLVVISAMGKTTNALEKVADAFYNNGTEMALALFEEVKKQHEATAKYLLVTNYFSCMEHLKDFYTEAEWLLHDKPVQEFDYYYDQIVSIGELLSTCIISYYLNERGIANEWVDVRDIIRTDDNFRAGNVDTDFTQQNIQQYILPKLINNQVIITQGFIGATDENETTTLGREGSDYSAALFANMLDAESLTIWKDVDSIMNADPKLVPDAQKLPSLNYVEVIEMAYYGAQVIHPKTIKPVQNKKIPLYVKSFIDPALPGTVIKDQAVKNLPPIIVIKHDQVMINLSTKDFSFIGDHHTAALYDLFEKYSLYPNITQNGAISLLIALDNRVSAIQKFATEAAIHFEVEVMPGLGLTTILHYNEEAVKKYSSGKKILLKQQSIHKYRILYTEN